MAILVATIAVVSSGYEAKRLDLSDASVWVANSARQVIGRANTEVRALDTVVESAGTDIDVVQDGSNVLLVDATNSRVDIVDPATAEVVESVPLPPESPELFLDPRGLDRSHRRACRLRRRTRAITVVRCGFRREHHARGHSLRVLAGDRHCVSRRHRVG